MHYLPQGIDLRLPPVRLSRHVGSGRTYSSVIERVFNFVPETVFETVQFERLLGRGAVWFWFIFFREKPCSAGRQYGIKISNGWLRSPSLTLRPPPSLIGPLVALLLLNFITARHQSNINNSNHWKVAEQLSATQELLWVTSFWLTDRGDKALNGYWNKNNKHKTAPQVKATWRKHKNGKVFLDNRWFSIL